MEQGHTTFYRKYRSSDFSELVGQPHVTTSLGNAIKNGRVSHAYLFSGPRGTGKTSAARIFAHKVNKLKVSERTHLDIIEIDAASNRRIDEIRDLREKVYNVPTSAPYKVYIIDEVHMLTAEAFNALLKTLEEPPAHVIFILATTEPHKLPDTIISRTQRYNFKPLSTEDIKRLLNKIATKEKINADPEAIELLAQAADGSMRDGISLLDQFATMAGNSKIRLTDVSQHLGMADTSKLQKVIEATTTGDVAELLALLDELIAEGVNVTQLTTQLTIILRKSLRSAGSDRNDKSASQAKLLKILTHGLGPGSKNWATLEALLIESCLINSPKKSNSPKEPKPSKIQERTSKYTPKKDVKIPAPTRKVRPSTTSEASALMTDAEWTAVLSHIKSNHNSLYALLKTAQSEYRPGSVLLTFRFQFHKRRLEEAKNKELLSKAIVTVFGEPLIIETELNTDTKASDIQPSEQSDVANVLEILGGEVVSDT